MNQRQQLSPKDWQILSEYLDGQLSTRDQARLEQRLRENNEMRTALEELRQTRSLLRSVKMQRVPRNFTLTPAMARQAQPKPILQFIPVLNFASAMATIAVVITLAVQLLPGAPASPAYSTTSGAAPAAPMAAQPAEKSGPEATQPIIVQWNGQPNSASPDRAMGMGGGGGAGDTSTVIEPAPITVPGFEIPGAQEKSAEATPVMGIQSAPALMPTPTAPAAGEAAPAAPAFQPTPMPPAAEAPVQPPQQPALDQGLPTQEAAALPPVEGSGPILGVKPPEQAQLENQDSMQRQSQALEKTAQEQSPSIRPIDWAVPALLALIAVGTLLAGLIIRSRNARV